MFSDILQSTFLLFLTLFYLLIPLLQRYLSFSFNFISSFFNYIYFLFDFVCSTLSLVLNLLNLSLFHKLLVCFYGNCSVFLLSVTALFNMKFSSPCSMQPLSTQKTWIQHPKKTMFWEIEVSNGKQLKESQRGTDSAEKNRKTCNVLCRRKKLLESLFDENMVRELNFCVLPSLLSFFLLSLYILILLVFLYQFSSAFRYHFPPCLVCQSSQTSFTLIWYIRNK